MSGPALNREPGKRPACGLNTGDPEADLVAGLGDVAAELRDVLLGLFDERMKLIIKEEFTRRGYDPEAVDKFLKGAGSADLGELDPDFKKPVMDRVATTRAEHSNFANYVKGRFRRALQRAEDGTRGSSTSLAPEDCVPSPAELFQEWIRDGDDGPAASDQLRDIFNVFLICPKFFTEE